MRRYAFHHISCLCVVLTLSAAVTDITLKFDIQEELPPKTVVAILKNEPAVTDQFTQEELRKISFRFLDPSKTDTVQRYFSIEEWTGVIEFVDVLDRDAPGVCRQLKTCDLTLDIAINPTELFTIVHVEINLQDKNDNAPRFPEEKMTVSVTESVPQGVLFPIVPAMDPDSPDNGIVEYNLNAPEGFLLEKDWNEDGSVELQLVLTMALDREVVDKYTLTVLAKDGGRPQKSGSVVIELIVNDENDNSPVFEKSIYTARIWENTAPEGPLVTVHATDSDHGDNGLVLYSFSKMSAAQYGSLFTIGQESGEIHLVSTLDYEEKDIISLTVIAKDQGIGSQPAYATVRISILDQNDHEPSIKLETSTPALDGVISIKEHCPLETFVVHVSVRDLDAGDAGKVDCVIDNELSFHLKKLYEKEYNIVTMADIDRELTPDYELKLECYDYGQPSLTTTATIKVLVEDINDHGPVFEQTHYAVTVDENSGRHTSVVQVVAHDADSGDNGRIVYSLADDAGSDFQIDPSSGLITSVINLDHESLAFLQFHVIAKDGGEKPRSNETLVSLTVRDLDDEPPKFEQKKYIFSITEGLPGRNEVGRVKATDKDDPPYNAFSYFLEGSPDELERFEINSDTGVIFTKVPLDRESQEVCHLMVIAQSEDIPRKSDTAQVDVHVMDVNDNQPILNYPKYGNETIHLSNEVPTGYVVTVVKAEDPDFGDNADLTYSISQGNEDEFFVIRPNTGEIVVNKQLNDFDNILFKLVIMVQDSGVPKKISVQTLNILVGRMNISHAEVGSALGSSSLTTSTSHIPIIIGVIAGCVLIAIILIIVILMIRRKHKKHKTRKSHQYWSERNMTEKEKGVNDMPMTEPPGSNRVAVMDLSSLTVKSDLLKQPQLNGKDDSDSGCADVSHTESQGSNEDPDGFPPRLVLDSSIGTFSHSPPQRVDSFSSWLHSESYNLNQKGNMYRVSEQNQDHHDGSPSSTLQNARKTVRFSEPRRSSLIPPNYVEPSQQQPALLQPLPDYSNTIGFYGNSDNYYKNNMEDIKHEDDGSILMIPGKLPLIKFKPEDGSLV